MSGNGTECQRLCGLPYAARASARQGRHLDILESSRPKTKRRELRGGTMDITERSIESEYFEELDKKTRFNDCIAAYYNALYEDTNEELYSNRAKSLNLCCKYWDLDYYRLQAVKDVQRVNLCKDKFCYNCQSLLALRRQAKYSPVLDSYRDTHDIWHIVFTVPNCTGERLRITLLQMYRKFGYMVRYLDGRKKIRGIDFKRYGYIGAVRALEVTQNREDKSFHPHFHCMAVLRKDLEFTKKYINSYSYSYGEKVRYFVDLEILLQKIWYLLMNGQEVNAQAVADLKEGYSVTADCVRDGKYHEVFKYAIKGSFKDGSIYDYETFKTLYYALHNRKVIQGYGVLHNFKEDEAGGLFEDELAELYEKMITELQRWETPVKAVESLEQVIIESKRANVRYISKNNLRSVLREYKRQEEKENSPMSGKVEN